MSRYCVLKSRATLVTREPRCVGHIHNCRVPNRPSRRGGPPGDAGQTAEWSGGTGQSSRPSTFFSSTLSPHCAAVRVPPTSRACHSPHALWPMITPAHFPRTASLTHSRPPLRLKIRGHERHGERRRLGIAHPRQQALQTPPARNKRVGGRDHMGTYRALRGRQLSQPTVKPTVERPPVELVPRRDALSL